MTGDREVSYRPIFFPVCPGSSNSPISLCETLLGKVFFQFLKWRIHFFHIDHNAPSLFPPPNICIIAVSNFSGVLQSSQEKSKTMVIQNFGGVNTVHYGLCENGQWGQY